MFYFYFVIGNEMNSLITDRIFLNPSAQEINEPSLEIFHYQFNNNRVYRKFLSGLSVDPHHIKSMNEIPFMPVEFFKQHQILTGVDTFDRVFISSGTGGISSRHYVADVRLYDRSFTEGFRLFYGNPQEYCFLALLPSYLEREGSSLVYMVKKLMDYGQHPANGFFMYDHEKLALTLDRLKNSTSKIILMGVSFALLDFISSYSIDFPSLIVMETGGMKGRGEEIVREELHERLTLGFGVETIHSEYGMTELLSQAYSSGKGRFKCPPWMKIFIRDPYDPRAILEPGKTGLINIMDLANIYSCSFIATQDIGRVYEDGSFEVLGRMDHSDIRGCNLLYV